MMEEERDERDMHRWVCVVAEWGCDECTTLLE